MKEKRLLYAIGWVKDAYITEMNQPGAQVRAAGVSRRRMWLIAAILALVLLLVGCAAAYFWLQDMTIGTRSYTQYLDESGKLLETPQETQWQVLSFAGNAESPVQKAFSEWHSFLQSYDPEGDYLPNDPDLPEIPNNYEWVYGCYTPEMMAKLEEITGKYSLLLLDEGILVQCWQSDIALGQGLGKTSLLKPESFAAMEDVQGILYPPYNFNLEFYLQLTGEDAAWSKRVLVNYMCYHQDYLPAEGVWLLTPENFDQWTYTTSDGVTLDLALDSTGHGFLMHQAQDRIHVVSITGNQTGSSYPDPDQVPGKKALEQMAEVFDFSLPLQAIDADVLSQPMQDADTAYWESLDFEAPVYSDFEAYLKDTIPYFSKETLYALYDVSGDGQPELLLGLPVDEYVTASTVLTMTDGQLEHYPITGIYCEDHVLLDCFQPDHSQEAIWQYYRIDPYNLEYEENLGSLRRSPQGDWTLRLDGNSSTITQEEADVFRAGFTPLPIRWQPLGNYPMSDGKTLSEALMELEVPVSNQQLHKIYAEYVSQLPSLPYPYYSFADLNGDGMDDLIYSADGEICSECYSYRYGRVIPAFTGTAYLCENGVLEYTRTRRRDYGDYQGELEEHEFFQYSGWEETSLFYLVFNRSAGTWQTDLDGTAIAEAEAQAVFDQHPRIPLEFHPIQELTN